MCVDSARSLPSPKISVLRRNQHFVMKSFLIFWFIRPQWLPLWSVALSDGSFQGSWNPGVWSSVQGLWCVPQSTPNSFNSEVLFIPFLVHICYICSIFIYLYYIYIYYYIYILYTYAGRWSPRKLWPSRSQSHLQRKRKQKLKDKPNTKLRRVRGHLPLLVAESLEGSSRLKGWVKLKYPIRQVWRRTTQQSMVRKKSFELHKFWSILLKSSVVRACKKNALDCI